MKDGKYYVNLNYGIIKDQFNEDASYEFKDVDLSKVDNIDYDGDYIEVKDGKITRSFGM